MISKVMAEKAGDKYGTSPETTAGTEPMELVEGVQGSNHVVQRTGGCWEGRRRSAPPTHRWLSPSPKRGASGPVEQQG
jgi:hypothetical protein